MDYSELGAYLKEERERQELSLDDIQQKTKISMSSLEAIEAGRVDDLPHPVYAKGFIKNYAQCLGLNAEELAGAFAQNAGIYEDLEDETEHLQSELASIKDRSKWPLVSILISLVLLAALGWLVYDLFWSPAEVQTGSQREEVSQSVEESINTGQKVEGQEVEDSTLSTKSEEDGAGPSQEAGGRGPESELGEDGPSASLNASGQDTVDTAQTQEPESHEQQAEEGSVRERAEEAQEAERTATEAEQETVASASGSGSQPSPGDITHSLQIDAHEACWMSASIDAKQRDLYLRPGESVTFRFEQSLAIKLGNAGGVKLIFDGQTYPLDADSGEVLSLTFP